MCAGVCYNAGIDKERYLMAITREAFETHCKPRIALYAAMWLIDDCEQKHLDDADLKILDIHIPRWYVSIKANVSAEMMFLLSAGV